MEALLQYCSQFIRLTALDEELIASTFSLVKLKRKSLLLEEGATCDFVAFLISGVIRHSHTKDGNDITCDITLPNSFVTDFKSLTQNTPSSYNFQAMKDSELLVVQKIDLFRLYAESKNIESLGRMMAEQVAQRNTEMAMSLASDKPEERVEKLLTQRPDLLQEVPQRYLANMVGISPESFSRIRARRKS